MYSGYLDPTRERRNLVSPLSHTVSGGREAIPATYINELVVNLATYEESHARDSRRVLCRARCYGGAPIIHASM